MSVLKLCSVECLCVDLNLISALIVGCADRYITYSKQFSSHAGFRISMNNMNSKAPSAEAVSAKSHSCIVFQWNQYNYTFITTIVISTCRSQTKLTLFSSNNLQVSTMDNIHDISYHIISFLSCLIAPCLVAQSYTFFQ